MATASPDSDAGKLFQSAAEMYGQVTLQNSADVEFRYSAEKNTKLGELNDIQGQLKTELKRKINFEMIQFT